MEPEGFKRFRDSKIRLYSTIKPRNIFPGEWESNYRGDGIEFSDVRPYEPGDDLRDLDLHTLVACREEEIVQRVVERRMSLYVWLDFSGSMCGFDEMFFARKPLIRDIALGLLLFSAANMYSPVGLCAFNAESTRYFPARVGERHCWEILNGLIEEEYRGRKASGQVEGALSLLLERAAAHSLVFFLSDFGDPVFEGDFTDLLRPLATTFDFVPIIIRDPLETTVRLGRSVRLAIDDSEGGRSHEIHLTPRALADMQEASARHVRRLQENFCGANIDCVILDTPSVEACCGTLTGFFQGRKKTRR